jgi:hypothetical protein
MGAQRIQLKCEHLAVTSGWSQRHMTFSDKPYDLEDAFAGLPLLAIIHGSRETLFLSRC